MSAAELCSSLAEWASAALANDSDTSLHFRADLHRDSWGSAGAEHAAAELAAALTAAGRGARGLCFRRSSDADTPLLQSLCRALKGESPLTELDLSHVRVTCAGVLAEIAAALAPGRSRLRTLTLFEDNFVANDGGCAALLQRSCACCLSRAPAEPLNHQRPVRAAVGWRCSLPLARMSPSPR